MQKIFTHLWYDKEAVEAAKFYASIFKDSKVDAVHTLHNTPSGDCDMVSFTLSGVPFMAISAGPIFKFTPAISMFAVFDSEAEIDAAWSKLSEGGKVLMEYQSYPWAKKYGWVADKYGLTWQLSMSEHHQLEQKITPLLMYTGANAGKAKEAIEYYTSVFPNSKVDLLAHYEKGEGDDEKFLKHARFTLAGQGFMAMDSSFAHGFTFNEAISFLIACDDQKEVDYYSEKLSAHPESEQCGWVKDKFGVSWQINPVAAQKMLTDKDQEKVDRVTQAFLKMKRFDIAALEKAFNGQ